MHFTLSGAILFLILFQIFFLQQLHGQDFEPYVQTLPGETIDFAMVPVEGGTFDMGTALDDKESQPDEQPLHEVQVDDFWMGVYEINWNQFEAFVFQELDSIARINEKDLSALGIDGISGASTPYVDMSFGMGKDRYPAITMTQYGAIMFCQWLSAKTGIFYRLPTEAEWEYACKKGALSEDVSLADQAWYKKTTEFQYEITGSKLPNALGVYDMLGNVSEWVLDQYDTLFYANSPKNNPLNTPKTLYPRVVRGGSYKSKANQVTCTIRQYSDPRWKRKDPQIPKSQWWHTNAPYVGFRIIRPKNQPDASVIAEYWLEVMDDY